MAQKDNSTRKPKDRHLNTPSEANRDKHINFIALENGDPDPSDQPAKNTWQERKFKDRPDTKHPRPDDNEKIY